MVNYGDCGVIVKTLQTVPTRGSIIFTSGTAWYQFYTLRFMRWTILPLS